MSEMCNARQWWVQKRRLALMPRLASTSAQLTKMRLQCWLQTSLSRSIIAREGFDLVETSQMSFEGLTFELMSVSQSNGESLMKQVPGTC